MAMRTWFRVTLPGLRPIEPRIRLHPYIIVPVA
jgi:hypothetical protein